MGELLPLRKKLCNAPHMIRDDSRFHCRSNTQGFVNAAEVVIREVLRN